MTLFQKLFTFVTMVAATSTSAISASAQAALPQGSIDAVNISCMSYAPQKHTCELKISGWAADMSDPARSIDVHLYVDNAFAGFMTTNQARPDVNSYLKTTGNHGFTFVKKYADNISSGFDVNRIRVHAIGSRNQGNPELSKAGTQLIANSSTNYGAILWKAETKTLTWNPNKPGADKWEVAVDPNENGTQEIYRTCGDTPGVMASTCNQALATANGRAISAFRVAYNVNVPADQEPRAFGLRNYVMNATSTMKAYRSRQIIYGFCADYSVGCSTGKFQFIFFDARNGNMGDCGGNQGGFCTPLNDRQEMWFNDLIA